MSDFQDICFLILAFLITVAIPLFFDTPLGQKLKKKISRKVHTIHLGKKRDAILRERLHLNHIEHRLRNEYNVRVYYELYEESDISADFDRYNILIVDCDTNKIVWGDCSVRQTDIDAVMTCVIERLDKGHEWRII